MVLKEWQRDEQNIVKIWVTFNSGVSGNLFFSAEYSRPEKFIGPVSIVDAYIYTALQSS